MANKITLRKKKKSVGGIRQIASKRLIGQGKLDKQKSKLACQFLHLTLRKIPKSSLLYHYELDNG